MKNIITKDIEYMKYVLGYKRGVVISEQQSTEKCIKGNCVNGKGTFKYENGDEYTGQWKNSEWEDGEGTYKYASGAAYTGQYINGEENGKGTYTNINGVKFLGDWVNGKLEGKNHVQLTLIALDKIKPTEKQTEKQSDAQYSGCLQGDCVNGSGAYKLSDGSVYNGQWKDGKFNGKGTYKWPDGLIYNGEFKDGKFNGKGTYKWPDGSVYTGQYKNNKRDGQGTFKDSDKTVYKGQWKDGEKNGQGTYKNKNGVKFSGIWVNGALNGKGAGDLDKIKPTKKLSNNATEPNNAQSNSNCVQPTEPTHRFKNDKNYQYAKSGECWWAKNITNNKWFNLTELVKTKPKFQSSIDKLNDGTDLIKL
jgi:hypothetical protein